MHSDIRPVISFGIVCVSGLRPHPKENDRIRVECFYETIDEARKSHTQGVECGRACRTDSSCGGVALFEKKGVAPPEAV